ncbi:MAG TPA: DNA recombination/repair protein RecA, partial [Candidatus Aminicenantes bacterium]|nr:DNA recombination/repair protein RecA [Candidatus Aminicenantes bacterium]
TTGGRALKFYSSLRVEVKRTMSLKEGNDVVGNRVRLKIVKNKMAPPFKDVEVDLYFGKGISREGDIIELAVSNGFVSKTGAWYTYGENRLGQGKEAVRRLLEENKPLYEELRAKILEKAGITPAAAEKEGSD